MGASSPWAESTMIGRAGKSTRTRWITSKPLIPGQTEVEQHEIEGAVGHARERVLAAEHRRDDVVLRLERDAQRPQHGRLVVDDQDAGALHGSAGSSTTNVAPPPGVGSTVMRPPWASTKPRLMARPRPVPPERSWPGRSR